MDLLSALLQSIASFGAVALIAIQGFLGGLIDQKTVVTILPDRIASSTPLPSSSQSILGSSTPQRPAASKPATTTPAKNTSAVPIKTAPAAPPPAAAQTVDPETLNAQTRDALVNILCLSNGGAGIHSISGSGVFIDSRGVILTNAHIGQYFLLKDYPSAGNVDCQIRTGSPAQPRYHAALLYLPPNWITNNASQIAAEAGKGTGEDDYAFLVVTGSTGPDALPPSFPNLAMTLTEPNIGDGMLLAAYPAGFLGGIDIEKNLYASSAYAAVTKLYTFAENLNIDLVSIGGTIVSQGGSSGGAMVRTSDGKLDGIISNATTADATADRDLRAITIAHINRSLNNHDQGDIPTLLGKDLGKATAAFAATTGASELETLKNALKNL
jgi:hypothetical protein